MNQDNAVASAAANPHASPMGAMEDDDEISLLDLLQVVVDNLRLLVLGPLLIGLAALGITFAIPPTFTAKVVFIPPKQQQSTAASALADLASLGGGAAMAGVKNPADQYVALIKSNSVSDALIKRFGLQELYKAKYLVDTRKALAADTTITAGAKDGLISLEFEGKDPVLAAEISNAYVEELRKLLNRVALTEAQMRRVFFEKLVNETKVSMAQAEAVLKTSGVDGAVLKLSAGAALEGVARLKAQISVQEVKLATMRGYLADTAPEFKQALNELMVLRSQLTRADQEDTKPLGQSDYISHFREFKYQEALLELYLRQFEMARLDESRDGAVVQVVDAAQVPERKSKPKKGQIAAIAALASGFALLLFVFIRQALRGAGSDEASAQKLQNLRTAWRRALGRPALAAPQSATPSPSLRA